MIKLNPKYRQILWMNILMLAGGIGVMVYMKWENALYALGAAFGVGVIEYLAMGYSLSRKQQKEEGGLR